MSDTTPAVRRLAPHACRKYAEQWSSSHCMHALSSVELPTVDEAESGLVQPYRQCCAQLAMEIQ